MNSTRTQSNGWLDRGEGVLKTLLNGTAALVMFLMMALTLVDVMGRYLFSAPVTGAFEVTELMLAAVIFLGLPLITAEGGHIAVDILDSALSDRVRAVQYWLVGLINVLAFGIFSWMLWEHAFKVLRYEDTTAVLQIPYAWLAFLMAVTASVSTLILFIKLLFDRNGKTSRGEQ
ncbi:TRAP transporter small permease [Marinobacterium sediminicola]|uniref:TRAP transporter small permease protein n=1 Tax=Marinobacterium sediminicola TaxID=518898 RepID=A0ABY1S0Q9_9GAMM|nr:TRAP transporter small permease [Marinobacterium sediminicola]ULG68327.1 TRAP transporter small permease [Marinobacterium sediminicola]SMR74794.1 TRAP-type C4-dicarboxylate transport system, small permease component [Marinobacterium sediminicola]